MYVPDEKLLAAANAYAHSRQIDVAFQSPLGFGSDGTVWPTSRGSAIKILYRDKNYAVERDCYLRLREWGVTQVAKLTVPRLVDHDDGLFALEIEIVQPPYLLDFGKAYIDEPPVYWGDRQLMANFYEEKSPLFGSNWSRVRKALASLEGMGIYYVDPRPQNISFGSEDDDSDLI